MRVLLSSLHKHNSCTCTRTSEDHVQMNQISRLKPDSLYCTMQCYICAIMFCKAKGNADRNLSTHACVRVLMCLLCVCVTPVASLFPQRVFRAYSFICSFYASDGDWLAVPAHPSYSASLTKRSSNSNGNGNSNGTSSNGAPLTGPDSLFNTGAELLQSDSHPARESRKRYVFIPHHTTL